MVDVLLERDHRVPTRLNDSTGGRGPAPLPDSTATTIRRLDRVPSRSGIRSVTIVSQGTFAHDGPPWRFDAITCEPKA
jgi:hypothetical protein